MKNELFAIFILVAAFVPGAALAELSEPPTAAQDLGAAEIDSGQTVLRQLLQLAREARVSLSEAIATAEKLHDGSRIAQIGFEKPDCGNVDAGFQLVFSEKEVADTGRCHDQSTPAPTLCD